MQCKVAVEFTLLAHSYLMPPSVYNQLILLPGNYGFGNLV